MYCRMWIGGIMCGLVHKTNKSEDLCQTFRYFSIPSMGSSIATTLDHFSKYDNQKIILPSRFLPDEEFLKYHNQERFKT